MSYQERRTIVSTLAGLLILAAYCFYASTRYQSGLIAADDMKSWAEMMLVFIGIGIAGTIIAQIVYHILFSIGVAIRQQIQNQECDKAEIGRVVDRETVTDEMDSLIELKSMRISFGVAGVGFMAALLSQAMGYSPAVMLNTAYVSFFIGSLVQGGAQLYFYRKGV